MTTLSQLSSNPTAATQEAEPIQTGKFNFYPGQLVVVGSRPGMGRTLFLLYLLEQMTANGSSGHIAFLSNEHTEQQLYKQLAVQVSGVPSTKIDEVMEQVIQASPELLASPNISFRFDTALWEDQKRQILEELEQKPHYCLFIDCLQQLYCKAAFSNRKLELEAIVRDLKEMAATHNTLIVISSSLNRSVERREGKFPLLSDLKGSGAIEEFSDLVLLLHRPEYYEITEDEYGNSLIGLAEVNCLKNRRGPSFGHYFHFNRDVPRFEESSYKHELEQSVKYGREFCKSSIGDLCDADID